jgi:hypothetical protein
LLREAANHGFLAARSFSPVARVFDGRETASTSLIGEHHRSYLSTRWIAMSEIEQTGRARPTMFAQIHLHKRRVKRGPRCSRLLRLLVILTLLGGRPAWAEDHDWGYGPSEGVGAIAIVLVVLLVAGRAYDLPSSSAK